MLKDSKYRGIFGIPATPFNEDESLDLYSLEKVLDFTLNNGCHGIVMPVMASEYQSLTDEEKKSSSKPLQKLLIINYQLLQELQAYQTYTQLSWLSMPKVLVLTQ